MGKKLMEALSYIDDRYISDAARRRKRLRRLPAVIAAVLALVIFFRVPALPLLVQAKAVAIASESRKMERPRDMDSPKFDQWWDQREQRDEIIKGTRSPIRDFAELCSSHVLSGVDDTNRVWSPVNAYIALAMTAELTGGDTRNAVLNVLNVPELESLRENISAVWEHIYQDNGREISVLANSLWLDTDVAYRQDVMEILAESYYASVYQGDLGSRKTDSAITNWLNNQTGGFLKNRTGSVKLEPETMLALASTVYFQSQWSEQFSAGNNTVGPFHTRAGDVEVTYMNAREYKMNYYWAEDYGAVSLWLENGAQMWFILPDADKTVDDVLESGDYMAMMTHSEEFPDENHKWMKVNLTIPQFDVSAGTNLEEALSKMGLEDLFNPVGNDFSPSIDCEVPVYLDSINQDTRVTIDEEGVTAATYILLEFGAGAAAPPDEIIDFVLDRPFLFGICYDGIPMFVGAVNHP